MLAELLLDELELLELLSVELLLFVELLAANAVIDIDIVSTAASASATTLLFM